MKSFVSRSRQSRELKRLVRENAAQGKALNVMDDLVFKAMLTSDNEDSREALRLLLCACTRRKITSVQVINNELLPAHLDAKSVRLDVHVTFNDGEAADLEMQIDKTNDSLKARAEVYAAMLLVNQTKRGMQFSQTKRVYQIFFLNCVLFPGSEKIPRRYFYQEEEEHDRLSEITEIIFYEMPKLEQRVEQFLSGKADIKTLPDDEKWCIYFKYRHEQQAAALIDKLCYEEEGIMRAEKAVTKVDRGMKRAARRMAIIKNDMERAEKTRYTQHDINQTSYQIGHREGIWEGRQEGCQEGRQEARLEIARKMKSMGDSIERIQIVTGLSSETVGNL